MDEDLLKKDRLLDHGDVATEHGVFQVDGQGFRGQGLRRQNQTDGRDGVQGLPGGQQPSAARDDLHAGSSLFPEDGRVENPGSGNGIQQRWAWLPRFLRGQAVAEILEIDVVQVDEA